MPTTKYEELYGEHNKEEATTRAVRMLEEHMNKIKASKLPNFMLAYDNEQQTVTLGAGNDEAIHNMVLSLIRTQGEAIASLAKHNDLDDDEKFLNGYLYLLTSFLMRKAEEGKVDNVLDFVSTIEQTLKEAMPDIYDGSGSVKVVH